MKKLLSQVFFIACSATAATLACAAEKASGSYQATALKPAAELSLRERSCGLHRLDMSIHRVGHKTIGGYDYSVIKGKQGAEARRNLSIHPAERSASRNAGQPKRVHLSPDDFAALSLQVEKNYMSCKFVDKHRDGVGSHPLMYSIRVDSECRHDEFDWIADPDQYPSAQCKNLVEAFLKVFDR